MINEIYNFTAMELRTITADHMAETPENYDALHALHLHVGPFHVSM